MPQGENIMKSNGKYGQSIAAVIGVVLGLAITGSDIGIAAGRTTKRPISDFVDAQGTFCLPFGFPGTTFVNGCGLFVPPVLNFVGWDTLQEVPPQRGNVQPVRCASVDYAGLENDYIVSNGGNSLGTQIDGTITERPLADGRAEVTVLLHTTNALTWVASGGDNGACDFATDQLLFGNRVPDVLPPVVVDAALGDSFLKVVFINTAPGDPLPDLEQLIFDPLQGQELRSISLRAQANGTLRLAFGVPDGTPGRAEVSQTGLFMTRFKGATADAFPAERINLQVVGK